MLLIRIDNIKRNVDIFNSLDVNCPYSGFDRGAIATCRRQEGLDCLSQNET